MNKTSRMQIKAVIVLIGIMFLALIAVVGIIYTPGKEEQPQGTYMNTTDAVILTENAGIKSVDSYKEDYITFNDVIEDFGEVKQLAEQIKHLDKKYSEEHFVLKTDWYSLYDLYLEGTGLSESINRIELTSLGAGTQLVDAAGNTMPEKVLLTEDKEYTFISNDFIDYRFIPISAYQKDGVLLTVYDQIGEEYSINNAWIMEVTEEQLIFFWNNYEVRTDKNMTTMSEEIREQVADIVFANGRVSDVIPKTQKVSGKILGVNEADITVEGLGTIPFSQDLKIYQIYDKLVEKNTGDLRVGYSFTDFVIEDGEIEACLITRDEAMENIRVLINNSGYGGRFHESVKATADTDFIVSYGTYDNMQQQEFKAGDIVEFGTDSDYFIGDRIYIIPKALTGKVELLSVERSQGNPMYRGTVEIVKVSEGLVVINEVLLEEYLYCVVPSEMPASYPLEALKAQAVCARTYAYRNMLKSGLPAYGAHVDDSTSFQVYNNIKENVETTKAVRETKGQLLYSNEALVDAYYYSTSCGFGTTAEIWKSGSPSPEYLQAKRIGTSDGDVIIEENGDNNEKPDAILMMDEEVFREYITNVYNSDYDSSEGWYRWSYDVESIDAAIIASRLQARQKVNKSLILKQNKNDEYVIKEVESFKEIYNISCGERLAGGVLDTLYIETDKGNYKVIGEYNIRYVLNNGTTKVVKQDGSQAESSTLLPSAYIVLDIVKDNDCVIGYKVTGGGYGHGVGMSQNGAKNMALAGKKSSEILNFFYEGSNVKTVY